jgi:hypothetical protein
MQNNSPNDTDQLSDYLKDQWDYIDKQAYDGLPFIHLVHSIEEKINSLRDGINQKCNTSGKLPDYSSINPIIQHHNFRKSWLDRTLQNRSNYLSWWSDYLSKHNDLLISEASESRKLVLLVHGAALIGTLTALGTVQQLSYVPSFIAIAIGALIGFMLAVVGQIIWLESYGDTIATLRRDFSPTRRVRRLASYGRYLAWRWRREIRWSFFCTYASVEIFPIYAAAALVLAMT